MQRCARSVRITSWHQWDNLACMGGAERPGSALGVMVGWGLGLGLGFTILWCVYGILNPCVFTVHRTVWVVSHSILVVYWPHELLSLCNNKGWKTSHNSTNPQQRIQHTMATPSSPKKRRRGKDQDECKAQPPKPLEGHAILHIDYDADRMGYSNTVTTILNVYRSRRDALVRAVTENREHIESHNLVSCDCGEFPANCDCQDSLADGSLSKEEAAKLKEALEPSKEMMQLLYPSLEAIAAMTVKELQDSLDAQVYALVEREEEDMTACSYEVVNVETTDIL